jgi:hypothetical protein
MMKITHALSIVPLLLPFAAQAETKDEWINLGTRMHSAFAPFIPVGIEPR